MMTAVNRSDNGKGDSDNGSECCESVGQPEVTLAWSATKIWEPDATFPVAAEQAIDDQ